MDIVILLFDDLTALDAIGPYEVLRQLPGARVRLVATSPGVVRASLGSLGLVADEAIADVASADILVIPGGFGARALARDEALLDEVRRLHATTTWTTSVCTGSLILAAAGLLDGLQATTHWAIRDQLAAFGAIPVAERVVRQGKIVTAAGVSAGIDMALTLAALIAGDEVAQAIQLGIEYDPAPPFDAGSPEKAPPHVLQMVTARLAAREQG